MQYTYNDTILIQYIIIKCEISHECHIYTYFHTGQMEHIIKLGYYTYSIVNILTVVIHPRSALRWRRNDHDGVSNHQPRGCLLNRLFRRRSKKTSKLRVTGLCVGNPPGPVNSPHKWPVTRKMFPFDDVIMSRNGNVDKSAWKLGHESMITPHSFILTQILNHIIISLWLIFVRKIYRGDRVNIDMSS